MANNKTKTDSVLIGARANAPRKLLPAGIVPDLRLEYQMGHADPQRVEYYRADQIRRRDTGVRTP